MPAQCGKELINNTWMRNSCTSLFCFSFLEFLVSLLEAATKILHLAFTVVGCPQLRPPPPILALSWVQLYALLAHSWPLTHPDYGLSRLPVTSVVCDLNRYTAYAESAFFTPFCMRKAGAKSHFENLLLSVTL